MPKPELEFFPASRAPSPGCQSQGHLPATIRKFLPKTPDNISVMRILKVDPGCRSTETFC